MTWPPGLNFESERLRFRPLAPEDLDLIVESWTDPEVIRFVDDRTYSEAELRDDMPMMTRRGGDGWIGAWAFASKETGEKFGTAALLPLPVEADDTEWDLIKPGEIPDRQIEIGYILKRAAWGQGYATEACRRTLRFGFEETPLEEIVATIDPEHAVSRRVLSKSGFREIGMIRAYAGTYPGLSIRREEWRANA